MKDKHEGTTVLTESFYDILQLDPMVIKLMAARAENDRERLRLYAGMVVRSLLIVLSAVAFIGGLTAVFGSENTPMAVVIFCIALCVRFVGFGYRIDDTAIALAIVFAVLTFAPAVALALPSALLLPFHLVVYFTVLVMTCRRPQYGNAGLFNFSYIYLMANPATGDALTGRCGLAVVGFLLCAGIMVRKHRGADGETRLLDVARGFSLHDATGFWQFRMALGMAVALSVGDLLGVERAMWMAFACAALLSTYPYSHVEREKSVDRVVGAIGGSAAYALLASVLPSGLQSLLPPLGGFVLGLSASYRFKTASNCFGALAIAQGLYGIQGAALLRVADTFAGVLLAGLFMVAYHVVAQKMGRLDRGASTLR